MKKQWLMIGLVILSLGVWIFAQDEEEISQTELNTYPEKLSYALGMEIGTFLKGLPEKIDLSIFIRGLEDTLADNQCAMTEAEAKEVRRILQKKIQQRRGGANQASAEQNRKEGEMFLERIRKKRE